MADTILKLSADSGTQIRYTLDKSEPTQDSTLYSSQVSIPEGAVLKAKSFKSGYLPSDTMVYRNQVPTFVWESVDTSDSSIDKYACYNPDTKKYYAKLSNNSCFSESTDLKSWSNLSSYSGLNYTSYGSSQMIYCNGHYFIVSVQDTSTIWPIIYTSTDLVNWNEFIYTSFELNNRYPTFNVFYLNNTYIIPVWASTAAYNFIFTSTDLINYTSLESEINRRYFVGAGIFNNKFWYTSNDRIYYTDDLQTWTASSDLRTALDNVSDSSAQNATSCDFVATNSDTGKIVSIIRFYYNSNYYSLLISFDDFNFTNIKSLNVRCSTTNSDTAFRYSNITNIDGLYLIYYYDDLYSKDQQSKNSLLLWNTDENSTLIGDSLSGLSSSNKTLNSGKAFFNTDTREYFYISGTTIYKLQQ